MGGKFLRSLIFCNCISIRTHRIADSRCAFAAQGLNADTTINDSPLAFVNVDLNICGGYNATTGKPYRVTSEAMWPEWYTTHGMMNVWPKQLSSSSRFPLVFEFRPVAIYLQPLVWFVCLHMLIFGGKPRPVDVSISALVYAYGTRGSVLIYLQTLVGNSNSMGKHELELSCSGCTVEVACKRGGVMGVLMYCLV